MGRRRGLLGVGATVVVLGALVGGCTGPGTAAPAGAVDSFLIAVSDGDGSVACAWLAPLVADELEQQSHEPCVAAVLEPDVADALAGAGAATPAGAEVFGSQAIVAVAAGTYFLAMDGDDWRITGAGCVTRPGMPADCVLAGG
ncbi:MAG TPA: hypothetical protein VGC04_09535 [Cellulomonas sp.]